MVSKPITLPDVIDYLYSNSVGLRGSSAKVSPWFGLACSDTRFIQEHCCQDLGITKFTLHNRPIGGLMESDCSIVNSEFAAKHVRYVGLFDDLSDCMHAFRGIAKASLGASRYKLYYGTGFRLMSEKEHKAFLFGYSRALALLEDVEDYNRTKSTIAMLYHHAPFFSEVEKLTSDSLNFSDPKRHEPQIERIIEKAMEFKSKVI